MPTKNSALKKKIIEATDLSFELINAIKQNYMLIFQHIIYDWQKDFINSSADHLWSMLMAGNQVGKTTTALYLVALHATGLYPDWYTGKRFLMPPRIWLCGSTQKKVLDVLQTPLIKGFLYNYINDLGIKTATTGLHKTIKVNHVNGISTIGFLSYEDGHEAFMGEPVHFILLDEECTSKIFGQCLARTVTVEGLVSLTMTPENGRTELVDRFWKEQRPHHYIKIVGWDDCPHMDGEHKEKVKSGFPAHELELRSKGIPIFGVGRVFSTMIGDVRCDPFDIPKHYNHIIGLDICSSYDGKTGAVWLAINPANNDYVLYDVYIGGEVGLAQHATALKKWGDIPVAWSRDAKAKDRNSGIPICEEYRSIHHVQMLEKSVDQTGTVGYLTMINDKMMNGKFKVFYPLQLWFDEFLDYQFGEKGEIMRRSKYHLMDSMRYAVASTQYASPICNRTVRHLKAKTDFNVFNL